jgi:hypothetical protein
VLAGLDITNPEHVARHLSSVTAGLESKNIVTVARFAVSDDEGMKYV